MSSRPLDQLPIQWAAWTLENLSSGVSAEQVASVLRESGFPDAADLPALNGLRAGPEVAFGKALMGRVSRLERALLTRYAVRRLRGDEHIHRVSGLDAADFYHTFYCGNEPVILSDVAKDWPLLSRWTPQYFAERYGHCIVEAQTGREDDPAYELNLAAHRTRMPFSEFAKAVEQAGTSNDFYICGNNLVLEEGLAQLFEEIPGLDGFLDSTMAEGRTFLWFGPRGTVTPLHYDVMNVLLVQVSGEKAITLAPPEVMPLMYNRTGVFSDVDFTVPENKRFPLFADVEFRSGVLRPGDALFIPVGWWHFIRSLSVSISLSFTNFTLPNTFAPS